MKERRKGDQRNRSMFWTKRMLAWEVSAGMCMSGKPRDESKDHCDKNVRLTVDPVWARCSHSPCTRPFFVPIPLKGWEGKTGFYSQLMETRVRPTLIKTFQKHLPPSVVHLLLGALQRQLTRPDGYMVNDYTRKRRWDHREKAILFLPEYSQGDSLYVPWEWSARSQNWVRKKRGWVKAVTGITGKKQTLFQMTPAESKKKLLSDFFSNYPYNFRLSRQFSMEIGDELTRDFEVSVLHCPCSDKAGPTCFRSHWKACFGFVLKGQEGVSVGHDIYRRNGEMRERGDGIRGTRRLFEGEFGLISYVLGDNRSGGTRTGITGNVASLRLNNPHDEKLRVEISPRNGAKRMVDERKQQRDQGILRDESRGGSLQTTQGQYRKIGNSKNGNSVFPSKTCIVDKFWHIYSDEYTCSIPRPYATLVP